MILLRNCPHNNGVWTFKDEEKERIIKASYSADGISRLRAEFAGYQWYFNRVEHAGSPGVQLIDRPETSYARLIVSCFPGQTGQYQKSLEFNRSLIFRAIEMYSRVWPTARNGLCPLHGDYSIGNLIISKNDVALIDWEHFRLNAAPWGFDLLNLLYESAYFSFKGRPILRKADSQVFVEVRQYISKLLSGIKDLQCNLQHLTKFMSDSSSIWGGISQKLPVVRFSNPQKSFLTALEKDDVPILPRNPNV